MDIMHQDYSNLQHTLPIVRALRGKMRQRQPTLLYLQNEPRDPAIQALIAAETSLQLLLDFVLIPTVEADATTLPMDVSPNIATMLYTLRQFASATCLPGQVAPVIEARLRPVFLPQPIAVDILHGLLLVLMESINGGASLLYLSIHGPRTALCLRIEADVCPNTTPGIWEILTRLLATHGGTVVRRDYGVFTNTQPERDHFETVFTLPLVA